LVAGNTLGWQVARVRALYDWVLGADHIVGLSAVLGPDGALVQDVYQLLSGSVEPVGYLSGDLTQVLAGAIAPSGEVIPVGSPDQHSVSGSVTPTGDISDKTVSILVGGEIAPSGTVSRAVAKGWSGAIAPTGVQLATVSTLHAGAITPVGVESHPDPTDFIDLAGSVAPVGDYLMFGPARQNSVEQLQFKVEWWNQPATGGRSEYADNPAFTDSYLTIEQVAPLAYHNQQIGNGNPVGSPPLQPNQTYYVRHLLETAAGLSVVTNAYAWATDIATVALAGGVAPSGYHYGGGSGTIHYQNLSGSIVPVGAASFATSGLRYDVYGAGASGNFPPFPTIGGSTVLLPANIASAGHTAIENFINAQPSGTTIVFDSSGGGTDYGPGTYIELDLRIRINNGNSTLKSDVHLWGFNCKIHQNRVMDKGETYGDARIFWMNGGGFERWTVSGFWFEGPNINAGTWDCRTPIYDSTLGYNWWSENGSAIDITAWRDFIVQDCYFTDLCAEAVGIMNDPYAAAMHYPPWGGAGGGVGGFEMKHCHVEGTGRQGICVRQGYDLWVHHNIIEKTALWPVNMEEPVSIHNDPAVLDGITIEDNIFARWNCHLSSTPGSVLSRGMAIGLVCFADEIDYIADVLIQRNLFQYGCYGYGSPAAEQTRWGYVDTEGCEPVIYLGWGPQRENIPPYTGVVIRDNTFDLEADQRGTREISQWWLKGVGIISINCTGLTIEDNAIHDKPIWIHDATSWTVTGNGSGTLYNTS
jgi:hypothetical protein